MERTRAKLSERRQRPGPVKRESEKSSTALRQLRADRLVPDQLLALQRDAGNRAVTRLLSRSPVDLDPGRFLEKHPELVESKKKRPSAEHATRSDATSYESQPEALREVIERSQKERASSWFSSLSDEARSNLVYTYNRMVAYGIWGHIRLIKSIKAGERPVNLGPLQLYVGGESQSVVFEVYDWKALRDTMLNSGRFGKDTGIFGMLHPGQTSMREWSIKTVDGLHLSMGKGTEADAHIDKRSPTNRPKGAINQFDFVRSGEHLAQELLPEFARKLLNAAAPVGIADAVWAGWTLKPADKIQHPDPSQPARDTDFVALKEYRFGSKGKAARLPASVPAAQASLDVKLSDAVSSAVEGVDPGVIRPTGRDKRDQDDYADAITVGLTIAGKVLDQARARGVTIGLDLGPLYHDLTTAEITQVKQQLTTIGKTAREALAKVLTARHEDELAQAVLGIRSCTVQLGRSLVQFPLH